MRWSSRKATPAVRPVLLSCLVLTRTLRQYTQILSVPRVNFQQLGNREIAVARSTVVVLVIFLQLNYVLYFLSVRILRGEL